MIEMWLIFSDVPHVWGRNLPLLHVIEYLYWYNTLYGTYITYYRLYSVYIYCMLCIYYILFIIKYIFFASYITYHMFCKDQSMNTYLKMIFYSSLILFCSYSMIHSHGAFHVLVQYWFSFCPSPHLLREVSPIFTWVWVWSTSLPVSWLRENGWKTRLVQM